MMGARSWGEERMGSYCLRSTEFQFHKMERVRKIEGGDSWTTLWMYLIPPNCALKNGWGKFNVMYTSPLKKKKKLEKENLTWTFLSLVFVSLKIALFSFICPESGGFLFLAQYQWWLAFGQNLETPSHTSTTLLEHCSPRENFSV